MDTVTITADDYIEEDELRTLASGTTVLVNPETGAVVGKVKFIAPCGYCDAYGHSTDFCPMFYTGDKYGPDDMYERW